jgi:hypothetical protein
MSVGYAVCGALGCVMGLRLPGHQGLWPFCVSEQRLVADPPAGLSGLMEHSDSCFDWVLLRGLGDWYAAFLAEHGA